MGTTRSANQIAKFQADYAWTALHETFQLGKLGWHSDEQLVAEHIPGRVRNARNKLTGYTRMAFLSNKFVTNLYSGVIRNGSMKTRIFVAISLCYLYWSFGNLCFAQARGWNGIVPLHSSRADVQRLMGPPTEKLSRYSDFYRTAKETLVITYSEGLPCGIGEKYSQWRVPRDTVVSILVTPTTPVSLSDLGVDEKKFEKQEGGHPRGNVYYVNEQSGESLRVVRNVVMEISYIPGAVDESLMCPGLAQSKSLKCKNLTPPRFDFYGDVSPRREKALLDNFVISLRDEPNRIGYIIAYAGRRARMGEAKTRAGRARDYVMKIRKFPAHRITAIDGGFRESAEVDLYVVPEGVCPPIVTPTVDPRDVKRIRP